MLTAVDSTPFTASGHGASHPPRDQGSGEYALELFR